MKRAIIIPILCFTMHFASAQQPQPGHPIDPVTNQKQNNTTLTWDNNDMLTLPPSELPSSINSAFKSSYPNQSDVTWYKYNNGYIASYNDNSSMNQRVIYDMKGNPVYMGKQIKSSSLPAGTNKYLQSKYPDATFDNVYEVKTPSGETNYQVWVDGKWMKFDKSGNLVPMK
ncbi:MAG: PepSY-like domain-containing protein [Chitinophagaceae bacterium]|nr:PepSY-like domain-containing protein [Chitinophagaceae bacterium]